MFYTILGLIVLIIILIWALSAGNKFIRFLTVIGGIIGFFIYQIPGLIMGIIFTSFILNSIAKLITKPKEFLSDVSDIAQDIYKSSKKNK